MDNTPAITKIQSLESMVVALTELLTVQEQVVSEQSERIINDEEALRKSNERFLEFISETAMRLKTPLEVVEENIAFVESEVASGTGDPANVALELKIQMKNLEQIRQNIIELNKAICEHSDEMSLATRKFLTE
jgi:hypothetical protein